MQVEELQGAKQWTETKIERFHNAVMLQLPAVASDPEIPGERREYSLGL